MPITFTALTGIGEVRTGDDVAHLIYETCRQTDLEPHAGDVFVIAQKIISKAEGQVVNLKDVTASEKANELARLTGKDPRLIELILRESTEVIRAKTNVIVVAHRKGYVMAQAGIDQSNVRQECGTENVLLLPEDCDASAAALRSHLCDLFGIELGVIISDSFGRAWRKGTVNVALGVAGLPALIDRRGERDRQGRVLESTEVGFADAIAAGAGLAIGEADEGTPVVLATGLAWSAPQSTGQALIRPKSEDMFR